jgi:hypothetical protein
MSASFTLPIGVDRNWTITIQQPDPITGLPVTSTQFIAGDMVSAEVLPEFAGATVVV